MEKNKNLKKSEAPKGKQTRRWEPELVLSVFLLIFILVAIALTAMLVVSYVSAPPVDADATEDGGNGGDADAPVFSGGSYPAVPVISGDSATMNSLNSSYAALVDAESGALLAHKNGNEKFHPASMTKIMTLIVLCEQLTEEDLDKEILLTEDLFDFMTSGVYAGASRHGFELDEKVRVKDLLYGIGIVSGADCTLMAVQAVYEGVSPKKAETRFVDLMNQKAEEMGLVNTHFENSVGMDGEDHYTTAAEMAAILAYAMECPLIEDILSASDPYSFYIKYTEDGQSKSYRSTYYSTLFDTNPDRASRFKAYKTKFGKSFDITDASGTSIGEIVGGKTGTLGSGTKKDPYVYSLATFAKINGKTYLLITGETTLSYGMMEDAKTAYENYTK